MLCGDLPDTVRVLVCVVRDPSDWRRVCEAGWYRIPVLHAPRGLAADYLAFYQTGAFGMQGCCVRYAAAVRQIRLVRRVDLLPEETHHPRAAQRYWQYLLAPLEELPLPVPARRLRRVTFIPTTWGQLRRAHDVTELWHAPEPLSEPLDLVWGAGVSGW